jgi:hypothetical protein
VTTQGSSPLLVTPASIEQSLMVIPDLLTAGDNEVEHVITYGPPKSGKTTNAGLLSEFFNILWFDGDKGLTALKYALPPELLKRIKVIRIPDDTDYPIMAPTMLRLITGRKTKICIAHAVTECTICSGNKAPVAEIELNALPNNWVVVMDSQTQFYASVLAYAYYKDTGKAFGTGVPHDYRGDFDFRGYAYQMCDKFGNYMKDLRCQWVSISHEIENEMEDGRKMLTPIAVSKNISSQYGKWFGSMVYATKANNKHNFMSSSLYSGSVQTGSRSGISLEKKDVPSLLHIFRPQEGEQLLKGSYTEWYFKEGYKDIKDRTKGKEQPPKPKEILSAQG